MFLSFRFVNVALDSRILAKLNALNAITLVLNAPAHCKNHAQAA